MCVNTLLLYFLGMYFIVGILAFGTWISQKIIKFKEQRRQEMIINFGIGLGVFLLFLSLLAMGNIFSGGLLWILFIGLAFFIWTGKSLFF
ncbi:MAG: hypothetical protein WCJ39_03140 [bacterium]